MTLYPATEQLAAVWPTVTIALVPIVCPPIVPLIVAVPTEVPENVAL